MPRRECARLLGWSRSQRPLGQRDRAEPFAAAAAQACRRGVEADVLAAFDLVREALLDLVQRDRGCEQDAALRGGAGKLRHGEERLARQRRRRIDIGAAAVGQQERAISAAALGDAVRIGQRQDRAGRKIGSRRGRDAGIVSPALRHPPRILARGASGRGGTDRADGRDRHRCRQARAPTGSRRCRRRAGPRLRAAASTTMRASRGGSGNRRSFRPSSVMRPSASMAPSSVSSARASVSAPDGGGSRNASLPGSAAPHCARSSSIPDRSADSISGRA